MFPTLRQICSSANPQLPRVLPTSALDHYHPSIRHDDVSSRHAKVSFRPFSSAPDEVSTGSFEATLRPHESYRLPVLIPLLIFFFLFPTSTFFFKKKIGVEKCGYFFIIYKVFSKHDGILMYWSHTAYRCEINTFDLHVYTHVCSNIYASCFHLFTQI